MTHFIAVDLSHGNDIIEGVGATADEAIETASYLNATTDHLTVMPCTPALAARLGDAEKRRRVMWGVHGGIAHRFVPDADIVGDPTAALIESVIDLRHSYGLYLMQIGSHNVAAQLSDGAIVELTVPSSTPDDQLGTALLRELREQVPADIIDFDRNAYRLMCVTELDHDGPDIVVLTIAVIDSQFRTYDDLGVVLQREDGGWTITALTSSLDKDDEVEGEVAGWLEHMSTHILPIELLGCRSIDSARERFVRAMGLDTVDWSVLDQSYLQRRMGGSE